MKRKTQQKLRWLSVLLSLFMLVSIFSLVMDLTNAGTPLLQTPKWARPDAKAIRKVSNLTSSQQQPNFLSNTDCQLMSYRTTSDKTMRNGCFTDTAFGLFDTDSQMVIFNGTDEAVRFYPKVNGQSILPWPKSTVLLALDTTNYTGSYMHLYKNALDLETGRDVLGRVISKKLKNAPDFTIKALDNEPLISTPQTIAFSSNASWMVTETNDGYFVRLNLATLQEKAFAESFHNSNQASQFKSQVSVSDSGQFIAINNEASGTFKVYDLDDCSGSGANERCESYDYRSFVANQLGAITKIDHLRFTDENMLSFEVSATDSSKSGRYLLAPQESIENLTSYLALGDSFTSGEGAFDYRSGTDTETNHCHSSIKAYPALITSSLYGINAGHSVACSGAVINDISSTNTLYKGQVQNNFTLSELLTGQIALLDSVETNFIPGYIAQHHFVNKYLPRVITVSVGGNDIGFGDIVETCVAPHLSLHMSDNTCFSSYEDRLELTQTIDRTAAKWLGLFKQLKDESPLSEIYAVGYPDIVSDQGECAINVRLNQSEREFTKEVVAYINKTIARMAADAGVNFVDISDALLGHRLCEAQDFNTAVNGLTLGKDAGLFGVGVLGRESYHPNALGHQLIAESILNRTNRLQNKAPYGPEKESTILEVPKSGRVVVNKMPFKILDSTLLKSGAAIKSHLDGLEQGLVPESTYTIGLKYRHAILGQIKSNLDGSLDINTSLGQVDDGPDIFEISGIGQNDQPIIVSQPIYVTSDPSAMSQNYTQSYLDPASNETPTDNINITASASSSEPKNEAQTETTRMSSSNTTPKNSRKPRVLGASTSNPPNGINGPQISATKTIEPNHQSKTTTANPFKLWWFLALLMTLWLIMVYFTALLTKTKRGREEATPVFKYKHVALQ